MKFIMFIDIADRPCAINVDKIEAIVESSRYGLHCNICLGGSETAVSVKASLEEVLEKISKVTNSDIRLD